MKLREFERLLKKYGLKVYEDKVKERYIVCHEDNKDKHLAMISSIKMYCLNTDYSYFKLLDGYKQGELLSIFVELANTKIEDRKNGEFVILTTDTPAFMTQKLLYNKKNKSITFGTYIGNFDDKVWIQKFDDETKNILPDWVDEAIDEGSFQIKEIK